MLKMILMLAMLAMSSCAPMIWDKDDGDSSSFNKDDYACRKDAIAYGGAAYVGYGVVQRRADVGMYKRCMVASGWSLRQ